MKPWRLIAVGLPAITSLGWGGSSQAADILIEFETITAASNVPPSPTTAASDRKAAASGLDFSPPEVNVQPSEDLPNRSTAGTAVGLQALSETLAEAPLPIVKMTEVAPASPANSADLFAGGVDSLVARAVGSAEGTRTPDGQKTMAYYGHVDPGNYAWNQGTFSYQHEAASPEEADQKQLARLKGQAEALRRKAAAKGLELTQEETLNGIDLANQAPLAALDRNGYIDWLVTAKKIGLQGQEAILWARTRSFLDPDTGYWNAPGLGNTIYTITHDQSRRQQAIAAAIALTASAAPETDVPAPMLEETPTEAAANQLEAIDSVLRVDLPAKGS